MRKILNNNLNFNALNRVIQDERFFLAGIVLLSTVLCGLMINPYLTVVNHDSAIFTLIGKALASGNGYLLESGPESQPYFTFPPLLPWVISGLLHLSSLLGVEAPQILLKGWIHLMFLGSIPLFYYWLRSGFSVGHSRVLTLLLAINPLIFKYSSDVLSDVPYWALSMAALYFLFRWRTLKNEKISLSDSNFSYFKNFSFLNLSFLNLSLGIVFIVLSVWTRQVGISLLLAFLLYLLIQKQWKIWAISALIFMLTATAWPLYEHHYRSTHPQQAGETLNQAGVGAVLDQSPIKLEFIKHFLVQNPIKQDDSRMAQGLAEYGEIIRARIVGYSRIATDQLLPPIRLRLKEGHPKENIIYYLTPGLGLLFLGGIFTVFRVYPLMCLYLLIYLGVFSVYPYISPRFLLPVFPFILLILYQGLLNVFRALKPLIMKTKTLSPMVFKRATASMLVLFIGIVFIGGHLLQTLRWVNAGYQLKIAQIGPSRRLHNKAYYNTLLWIKENTPKNSLIITRKPPVAYYYGNRKALAFPFTADTKALIKFIEQKQSLYASTYPQLYVLEDTAFGETERYLSPVLKQYPQQFKPVYNDPAHTGTTLWQVVPNGQNSIEAFI